MHVERLLMTLQSNVFRQYLVSGRYKTVCEIETAFKNMDYLRRGDAYPSSWEIEDKERSAYELSKKLPSVTDSATAKVERTNEDAKSCNEDSKSKMATHPSIEENYGGITRSHKETTSYCTLMKSSSTSKWKNGNYSRRHKNEGNEVRLKDNETTPRLIGHCREVLATHECAIFSKVPNDEAVFPDGNVDTSTEELWIRKVSENLLPTVINDEM